MTVLNQFYTSGGDGQHSLTAVEYSDKYYGDDDNHPHNPTESQPTDTAIGAVDITLSGDKAYEQE